MEEQSRDIEALSRKMRQGVHEQKDTNARRSLSPLGSEIQEDWDMRKPTTHEARKRETHFWLWLFVFAGIFLVGALLYAYYTLRVAPKEISSDAIEIQIDSRSSVNGGEEFPVEVEIVNTNRVPLEGVVLTFEYRGVEDIVTRREIGVLDAGVQHIERFDVTLLGQVSDQRTLTATLEYETPDSSSVFIKDPIIKDIVIRSTPIEIEIEAPDLTVAGQQYTLGLTVRSRSQDVFEDIVVLVDLPDGFFVQSTTPENVLDENSIWVLGSVYPGDEHTLEIAGTLEGSASDTRFIQAVAGFVDAFGGIETPLYSIGQKVIVDQPPVSVVFAVDGSETQNPSIVSAQDVVPVTVFYENTSMRDVRDVEIAVSFSGSAYDPSGVIAREGFFDSNTHTLLFDDSAENSLKNLEPGDRGSFSFQVRPLVSFTRVDTPEIIMRGGIFGKDDLGEKFSVQNIISRTITIAGDILFDARTTRGVAGPVPPKVGELTTYEVVLLAETTTSDIESARVSTRLPSYMVWEGMQTSSIGKVRYNPDTRNVVWDAGVFAKDETHTASFRVSLRPSLSQVGTSPRITESIIIEGTDTFTKKRIRSSSESLTTMLTTDAGKQYQSGRVSQ